MNTTMSRKAFLGAAGALLATLGASCLRPQGALAANTYTLSENVLVSDDGTKKVVADTLAREVEIPSEVSSCCTFTGIPFINACVEAAGAGHTILNDMSESFSKDKYHWQYIFAPQTKDAPVLQTDSIDIEAVLALAPDVCFTQNKNDLETLTNAGLATVYLGWDDTEGLKYNIRLLGEIFSTQDVAEEYCTLLDDGIAEAEKLAAGIDDKDRKTVFYGGVSNLSLSWLVSEWWIKEAGGVSVTADYHTEEKMSFEVEDLVGWNPDVIIVSSDADKEEALTNDKYAGITAVQNGEVYVIPTGAHLWGARTPENIMSIFWCMNKLYPEVMPTEEFAKKIKTFYKECYQVDLTDDQIAEFTA